MYPQKRGVPILSQLRHICRQLEHLFNTSFGSYRLQTLEFCAWCRLVFCYDYESVSRVCCYFQLPSSSV